MNVVVATFYHFFDFPHFAETRQALREEMARLEIKGTLLLSDEGINSTLAGSRESVDAFLRYLQAEIVREAFTHKESFCERQPFARTKVRLKKETISLGEKVAMGHVGQYVSAAEWNALIADPEVIVLDARNDYEVHLGTFEGAVDPRIRTFKELPDFVRRELGDAKQKKIATFCTGGIRCEKLTAWMKQEGFEEVYHLEGGILKYLEEIPQSQSAWKGECYVFDNRIAVGHGLVPSTTAALCSACGYALAPEDHACCPHCERD
ncbi:MAG: rhodanese-related sulfurtransferase [Alphaproteobacteria bacterium]|nr:rhodanese-related sulfurtransferase [Alphaproteobacteria bacterium]